MTDLLAVVAGAALVVLALVDLIWTTVASGSGAGPLGSRLVPWLWKAPLALHRRRPSHRLLSASGVVLVLLLLALWIGMVLAGWWLITLAGEAPVVSVGDGETGGALDRLYFTGYTIFTLGNGDFRPSEGLWQMVTVAMAGNGLVLVTLAITYLVPVSSAAAGNRHLAATIASLGRSPAELVSRAWTGEGFGLLETHLANLTPLIHSAGQSHLTYPVLHYLHAPTRSTSLAPNLVTLSLALDLLEMAVRPDARPHLLATGPCRRGIDMFLETLGGAHIHPADRPAPLPDLEALADAGIPLVEEEAFHRAAADRSEGTRRLLAGLLAGSGWS